MVKDYIKKLRKECNDKNNPIIVTKYKRNKKFGLTPEEFMRRCIYHGKVIYSEINSIPVQESNNMPMVFSEDDVYCNMSKFRNPYNIIFVCGTSGSGKSTLSKYLSDVHNATLVSLDHIMFWLNRKPRTDMDVKLFDPTIYKYYTEKGIPFDELVEICNSKNRKFFDYAKNRILDYIEWLSNQDEQFIIEGIQTSWVYNKNKFIVYPFIFKGTSMIKSWIRRAMREKDFFYKFDLKIALKWSSEWKRDINRIRNAVMLKTTDIYTRKEVYVNNETAKNSM
jgi:adenylate kinase family enzyme